MAWVNMADADRAALQKLIKMCLGAPPLQLTKMRLTRNKNESANHAISAWLPKMSNFQGRLCSVINSMNYGGGVSMQRKLESVQCPIARGRRVICKTNAKWGRVSESISSTTIGEATCSVCKVWECEIMLLWRETNVKLTSNEMPARHDSSPDNLKKPWQSRPQQMHQQWSLCRKGDKKHGEHAYSLRSRQLDDYNYLDKQWLTGQREKMGVCKCICLCETILVKLGLQYTQQYYRTL